jgi:SAM-dependent methyltransferase
MDFSDPHQLAVFFDVHKDLPREGPGNRESTEQALSLAGSLPHEPEVLDIGCGPGMQTIHLAEILPNASVTAVDLHKSFVDKAQLRVLDAGLDDRISVDVGDMTSLAIENSSFDLIWCEGAAYNMGIEKALVTWKPLLKPGGKIALTDAVWLKPDPPEELAQFWTEYPDMNNIDNRRDIFGQCGYKMLGDFVLPEAAWRDDYYGPMETRLEILFEKYADDKTALSVLEECFLEINLYEKYSDYYGYVFLVASI